MRQDAVLVREMGRMLQEPSTPDSSAVAASTAALHLLVSPSPASPSPTPLFQQQLAHASSQSAAPVHHANQNPILQSAFSQNMNQNMFPPQQLPMPNGHFFPAANGGMPSMKHPGMPFHPMQQPHLPPVPMMVPPHMQPHLSSHMQPPMQPPMGFPPMFPAVGHHFPMGANGPIVPPPMMVPPPVFMPRQMDPQMQSRQLLQQQMAFAMAHGLPPMPMPSGALLVPPAHSAAVSASSSAQGSRSSSPPPLNDASAYHTATVESHSVPMHQPTTVSNPIPAAPASTAPAAIPVTSNSAAPSAGSEISSASQSDESDYEESDYASDDSQSESDQSDSAASEELSQSESDDESAQNVQPPPVPANSSAPLSFAAVIAKNAPGVKPAVAPAKSTSSTTATSSTSSNAANSSLPKQVLAAAQAAGQITLPQLLQQQQSGQAATASVRLQGIGPISISILASTPATPPVAAPSSNPSISSSNRVAASGSTVNVTAASTSSNKPASVAPPKIVTTTKTIASSTVPAVVPAAAASVPILESSSESEESDIEDDATTKLAKLPPATNLKQRYRSLWSLSENDEKAKIRDFWLALTEQQRGQLLRVCVFEFELAPISLNSSVFSDSRSTRIPFSTKFATLNALFWPPPLSVLHQLPPRPWLPLHRTAPHVLAVVTSSTASLIRSTNVILQR
jgi:hypothetical protein